MEIRGQSEPKIEHVLIAAILLQLFKLLFDYDNFLAGVQRNCLNKQTEFSFFFIAMLQT